MNFNFVYLFIFHFGITTAYVPTAIYNESCPVLEPFCYWCVYENIFENDCRICKCNDTVVKENVEFGPLVLTSNQARLLVDRAYLEGNIEPRAGSSDVILKWDNQRQSDRTCHVPYYFETNPPMSERSKEVIHRAISAINAQTCIKFVPAVVGDTSIIRFKNSSDCSYFIGRRMGIRTVRGCTYSVGEALKAIMHGLGFFPETNRPDRDDHVVLFPEHMKLNKLRQIMKIRPDLWQSFNFSYDMNSITHFGAYEFSAYGGITVVDKATGTPVRSNKWALSSGDVRQIRRMYNCSGVRGISRSNVCYNLLDYGLRYRGKMNVTQSGMACQPWDSQTPHAHKIVPSLLTASKLDMNYCRNPDMRDQPWCYTTNSSLSLIHI